MGKHKQTIPFDFETAVAEAKRDYPKETKDTTFINGSDPDAKERLHKWAVSQGVRVNEWKQIADMIDRSSSFAFSGQKGGTVLVVPTERQAEKLSLGDRDRSNHWSFDHELGHIVMDDGMGSALDADYTEAIADNFAARRGIKRGTIDKEDLQTLATMKDAGFLILGGYNHLTSMSLDGVIINPKNTDFISLTPQQIKKTAEQHAQAFGFTKEADSKFLKVKHIGYKTDMTIQERFDGRVQALAEIALSAPQQSQEFYVAARILNNIIEKGVPPYLGRTVEFNNKDPQWQNVRQQILEKAGDRDIGARKAMENESFTRPQPEMNFLQRASFAMKAPKI